MVSTEDIISAVSDNCIKIGFAAETENLISNANDKLKRKNMDMIIANDVSSGRVFGSDYTEFTTIKKDGILVTYGQMSKIEAAHIIIGEVATLLTKEEK